MIGNASAAPWPGAGLEDGRAPDETVAMSQFERHVLVCTSGKVCPRQNASDVISVLRQRVREGALHGRVRVNKAGCMAQCGWGPVVVVYPEAVWYAPVTPAGAERIYNEHLCGGQIVEELLYRPPGPGKQICASGCEPIPPEEPA